MNLGNNLIILRKKENISQEELAEKLNVSRQAVSKWESGCGYPETENLIKICEIFNCSMDTLVKGKIEDTFKETNEYDAFMKKFGTGVSLGVFLLLIGTTFFLIFMGLSKDVKSIEEEKIILGTVVLLIFALMAVPLFIINGLNMDAFKKKNPIINNQYTEEEIEKFDKKFAIVIATNVSIILLGVIAMLLMYGLKIYKNDLMPVGIFMIFITISVPFLTYFGIQKDKYDINKYNKINGEQFKKENELIGKISAVIMIITIIVYLILGFILKLWAYNWILFPISGMICGIVTIILNKEN